MFRIVSTYLWQKHFSTCINARITWILAHATKLQYIVATILVLLKSIRIFRYHWDKSQKRLNVSYWSETYVKVWISDIFCILRVRSFINICEKYNCDIVLKLLLWSWKPACYMYQYAMFEEHQLRMSINIEWTIWRLILFEPGHILPHCIAIYQSFSTYHWHIINGVRR